MACDGNNHNLVDVYEHYDAMGEAVVRWCKDSFANPRVYRPKEDIIAAINGPLLR